MDSVTLFNIISLAISILTLFGFGVVMKHFWDDRHERKKAETQAEKDRLKAERQAEIREVIKEEVKDIKDGVDKANDKLVVNTEGTITLLRDRMKSALNDCRKKHFATSSDKANWHDLYNSYATLGGNHFREYVDQWKTEIDNMPTEDEYLAQKAKKRAGQDKK